MSNALERLSLRDPLARYIALLARAEADFRASGERMRNQLAAILKKQAPADGGSNGR